MGVGKLYLYTRKKRSKQTINPNSYFIIFFTINQLNFYFAEKPAESIDFIECYNYFQK